MEPADFGLYRGRVPIAPPDQREDAFPQPGSGRENKPTCRLYRSHGCLVASKAGGMDWWFHRTIIIDRYCLRKKSYPPLARFVHHAPRIWTGIWEGLMRVSELKEVLDGMTPDEIRAALRLFRGMACEAESASPSVDLAQPPPARAKFLRPQR